MSDKTYSQIVAELSELRDRKPRTLKQMFGRLASEEDIELHQKMVRQ